MSAFSRIAVFAGVSLVVGCHGPTGDPDGGGAGGGTGTGGGSGGPVVVTTRYQVTVDQTPLRTLPSSCWLGGTPPTTQPPATRLLTETWDLIEAPGQSLISVSGPTTFPVGDADPVILSDVLLGGDGGFPAQVQTDRTLPNPSAPNPNFSDASAKSAQIVITSQQGGLSGTLKLKSDYLCTSCQNNNGHVNCAVDLPFTASVVTTVAAPEPKTGGSWRLALETTALSNLPPSCYVNNTVPTIKRELENRRTLRTVDIWSAGASSYLEAASFTTALGDARPITIDRPIRSDGGTYSGMRVDRTLPNPNAANPNFSETKVGAATFTFNDGAGVKTGNLALRSEYTCTSCINNNNEVNCSAWLDFVAVKGGVPLPSAPPASTSRDYRVAIDDRVLANLPPTCFQGGTAPFTRTEYTNLAAKGAFSIQTAGGSNLPVLAITPATYVLGDAAPVTFSQLPGFDAGVFIGSSVSTMPVGSGTETRKSGLTATFTDQSELTGGALDVVSTVSCSGCTTSGVSCSARLPFEAGAR